MKPADTAVLEEKIGYTFANRELLRQALTHSSHAREQATAKDNEQLEFLGDSVLGFLTSQELFRRFPNFTEGELSKLRARLVSARHLVRIARDLNLGAYLHLGRGEEKSGGRAKAALLVDALEALVAALFLEAGLDVARGFVLEHLIGPELDRFEDGLESARSEDYKSELQERLHASGRPEPRYVVIAEEGPEHKKVFTMEIRLLDAAGQEFAVRGQGTTKKRAGQAAAREALIRIDSASPPGAPAS
ncbi:MAG: ribonuclease III [Candidatus Korobacteraceae bacterium]|jgi:ribonuclease-3